MFCAHMTTPSRAYREAAEAPDVVARQLAANEAALRALVERLHARPPRFVVASARGSSSHAAYWGKYLIEQSIGLVVGFAAPSIQTIYAAPLQVADALFITVSQSGRSPDLIAVAEAARRGGALTVALVNDASSPLAATCEFVVPLHAGPELSVAATKSYIAAVSAFLHLAALWSGDAALDAAVRRLPQRLAAGFAQDWSAMGELLAEASDLLVIGRGTGFAAAKEIALKLKETCGLHAEAFSGAELLHGPVALAEPGFPVLAVMLDDAARPGMVQVVGDLRAKGARVLAAGPAATPPGVPSLPPDHPLCDALPVVLGFYGGLDALARARGRDIDNPRHLRKVTETL